MNGRPFATLALLLLSLAAHAAGPLPSWNHTPTRQAILAFVDRTTRAGSPDFVAADQRIAVFDMDGTLLPEKPLPGAIMPLVAEVKAAAAKHPELKKKPAVAALLAGDIPALEATGQAGLDDIVAAAVMDKTTDDAASEMRRIAGSARNPRFGRPYPQLAYAPMVELLAYLRESGYQVWIASGSPIAYTRSFSQQAFGVPPQQVIGSSLETRFAERDHRAVLVYTGRIGHFNDKEGKPPAINLAIGMRPVFVGGNVGGSGDIAMMCYSRDRAGPSFQLLIDHDDAAREFAYAEKDHYSLDAAKRYGFTVVSIRNDWSGIFATSPSADANTLPLTR